MSSLLEGQQIYRLSLTTYFFLKKKKKNGAEKIFFSPTEKSDRFLQDFFLLFQEKKKKSRDGWCSHWVWIFFKIHFFLELAEKNNLPSGLRKREGLECVLRHYFSCRAKECQRNSTSPTIQTVVIAASNLH